MGLVSRGGEKKEEKVPNWHTSFVNISLAKLFQGLQRFKGRENRFYFLMSGAVGTYEKGRNEWPSPLGSIPSSALDGYCDSSLRHLKVTFFQTQLIIMHLL